MSRELERFAADVEIRAGSECWWWAGRVASYGPVLRPDPEQRRGRQPTARRVAYAEWVGSLTRCHDVWVSCGNELCVNPEHLVKVSRMTGRPPVEPGPPATKCEPLPTVVEWRPRSTLDMSAAELRRAAAA